MKLKEQLLNVFEKMFSIKICKILRETSVGEPSFSTNANLWLASLIKWTSQTSLGNFPKF